MADRWSFEDNTRAGKGSLVRRGLLRMDDGAFVCITPAGLRVLADELEAGRVEGALEWAKRSREEAAARKIANGESAI